MALRRGRPKPRSFSGLFLPSLAWELSVEELPMRGFEEHPTAGTFFRNARRFIGDSNQRKNLAKAAPLFRQLPQSRLRDDLLAAIDGDLDAERRVAAVGPWQIFLAGAGHPPWLYLAEEYTRIESLCSTADEALGRGDFAGAADAVAHQPEVAAFWLHGSLKRLADAATLEQSLVPRLVAYLEVQMSCIAMASLIKSRSVPAAEEVVRRLFEGRRRPGANFMRYLLEVADARTQADLLNLVAGHLGDDEVLPSEATMKRWFSGAIFPKAESIRPLALAVASASLSTRAEAELRLMFWCARRANAAMELAAVVHDTIGAPAMLGAEDVHSWAETACSHWMTRWRAKTACESSRPT